MFVMPINVAEQLVTDRRVSYEAVAFRHHFRRYLARQVEYTAPTPTAGPRQDAGAVVDLRDTRPPVSTSKVA
jgi:hypothetical protein